MALASLSVVGLVMSRRARRADVASLVMTGPSRRRNPLGRRCRSHHGLELVKARDALGMKLGVSDRSAFLANPRHAKGRVRLQQAIVFLGFHQVALRIPVQVARVDTRRRRHHHGLAARLCNSGRYGHRKASSRQSKACCSLDNHVVTSLCGTPFHGLLGSIEDQTSGFQS